MFRLRHPQVNQVKYKNVKISKLVWNTKYHASVLDEISVRYNNTDSWPTDFYVMFNLIGLQVIFVHKTL